MDISEESSRLVESLSLGSMHGSDHGSGSSAQHLRQVPGKQGLTSLEHSIASDLGKRECYLHQAGCNSKNGLIMRKAQGHQGSCSRLEKILAYLCWSPLGVG